MKLKHLRQGIRHFKIKLGRYLKHRQGLVNYVPEIIILWSKSYTFMATDLRGFETKICECLSKHV
jgi:hypothetical protein